MQFELYNIVFACDTEWKPNNEYNKADILEELQVSDPAFYYVINMGVSGCQVSPYYGEVSDIKKPFYSLAALLIDYLDSSDFVALVSVNSNAYYIKVESGLINASSDRIMEVSELELFVESIADQTSGDIFIDNKLSRLFPDNSEDDFENFEKVIKKAFKKNSFKYIQLKGKTPVVKVVFQFILLLGLLYLLLWVFDLLDYVGMGDKKEIVAVEVGKSEAQKRKERRELMKKEVRNSLSIDTKKPLPHIFLNVCDEMRLQDVSSLGGWQHTFSQCMYNRYISSFVRTKGKATSMNLELIALERYSDRNINVIDGMASIIKQYNIDFHEPLDRSFLPERPVLDSGRSFFETRKDLFLNVRMKDNLHKKLNIIYENVSYPVDDDLNYSSATFTFSKVPFHVLESFVDMYNKEYVSIDVISFSERLVTAEITIYYR